jgi:hypothetical protein
MLTSPDFDAFSISSRRGSLARFILGRLKAGELFHSIARFRAGVRR